MLDFIINKKIELYFYTSANCNLSVLKFQNFICNFTNGFIACIYDLAALYHKNRQNLNLIPPFCLVMAVLTERMTELIGLSMLAPPSNHIPPPFVCIVVSITLISDNCNFCFKQKKRVLIPPGGTKKAITHFHQHLIPTDLISLSESARTIASWYSSSLLRASSIVIFSDSSRFPQYWQTLILAKPPSWMVFHL